MDIMDQFGGRNYLRDYPMYALRSSPAARMTREQYERYADYIDELSGYNDRPYMEGGTTTARRQRRRPSMMLLDESYGG